MKLPQHPNDFLRLAYSINANGAWVEFQIDVRDGSRLTFVLPFFRIGRLMAGVRDCAVRMRDRIQNHADVRIDADVSAALEAPTITALTPIPYEGKILLTIEAEGFAPMTYATDRDRLSEVLLQIVQNDPGRGKRS